MSARVTRRDFLKTGASAVAAAVPASALGSQTVHAPSQRSGLDLLRRPDYVSARLGARDVVKLQYSAGGWSCPGIRVTAETIQAGSQGGELPISVTNEQEKDLTYLHIRWDGRGSEGLLAIGDHWERSYGDLEWRGTIPERVMPWYFLTLFDGSHVNGYGVKTSPSAFCFWQRDAEGITLTSIDLRNGGDATELGGVGN